MGRRKKMGRREEDQDFMLVGDGPRNALREDQDLHSLYGDLKKLYESKQSEQASKIVLPVLLVPGYEMSMDERHIAVWCIADYKNSKKNRFSLVRGGNLKGTKSNDDHEAGKGFAMSGVMAPVGITNKWIAKSVYSLADLTKEGFQLKQYDVFFKLWNKEEPAGLPAQYVIGPGAKFDLINAFIAVGNHLKETMPAIYNSKALHPYFLGKLTHNGESKASRDRGPVSELYSPEAREARWLGSPKWQQMLKDIHGAKGSKWKISIEEVKQYISGNEWAKNILKECGADRDFKEFEDSVDHIVVHVWGGVDHPMNYFLMPSSLNSMFRDRFTVTIPRNSPIVKDMKEIKENPSLKGVRVSKMSTVGTEAFHAAQAFQGLALNEVSKNRRQPLDLIADVRSLAAELARTKTSKDENLDNGESQISLCAGGTFSSQNEPWIKKSFVPNNSSVQTTDLARPMEEECRAAGGHHSIDEIDATGMGAEESVQPKAKRSRHETSDLQAKLEALAMQEAPNAATPCKPAAPNVEGTPTAPPPPPTKKPMLSFASVLGKKSLTSMLESAAGDGTGHAPDENKNQANQIVACEGFQGEGSSTGSKEKEYGLTPGQKVVPSVDEHAVQQLENMGFAYNKAMRAMYFKRDIYSAVDWLLEHEDDPDINQPLLLSAGVKDDESGGAGEKAKGQDEEDPDDEEDEDSDDDEVEFLGMYSASQAEERRRRK